MSLLKIVCTNIRERIGDFEDMNAKIPGLEYNKVKTSYFEDNNLVGYQQRAFTLYWIIKEHERTGGAGLDIGCGQVISPFCIGLDYYSGYNHPQYGGEYWPDTRGLGEILPFRNESFDFIISLHSIEHMKNPISTITEWLRVLKHNGKMIIVTPDRKFGPAGDRDHAHEYTSEELMRMLNKFPNIRIIEHDTFHNDFSVNSVVEKI